jgi:transcriptional regulator with XRE-family HTH domain
MTQQGAAKALGVSRNTVANYDTGKRFDPQFKDSPVEVPKVVLLACAALENGLSPINWRD